MVHTTTREPKRAHFRAPGFKHHPNSTKGPPRGMAGEGRNKEVRHEREKKKARNFGPPTLRGPTLRGPTLQGPSAPPFGPHFAPRHGPPRPHNCKVHGIAKLFGPIRIGPSRARPPSAPFPPSTPTCFRFGPSPHPCLHPALSHTFFDRIVRPVCQFCILSQMSFFLSRLCFFCPGCNFLFCPVAFSVPTPPSSPPRPPETSPAPETPRRPPRRPPSPVD